MLKIKSRLMILMTLFAIAGLCNSFALKSEAPLCYKWSADSTTRIPAPGECTTPIYLVNCDANQPGYSTLYYDIDQLGQKPNYGIVGKIEVAEPQLIHIPPPNTWNWIPSFSHDNNNWFSYEESLSLNPNQTLYVSTLTRENPRSPDFYLSTTGCPSSSQSGQSDALTSKTGSSVQRQTKAMTSGARAVKR